MNFQKAINEAEKFYTRFDKEFQGISAEFDEIDCKGDDDRKILHNISKELIAYHESVQGNNTIDYKNEYCQNMREKLENITEVSGFYKQLKDFQKKSRDLTVQDFTWKSQEEYVFLLRELLTDFNNKFSKAVTDELTTYASLRILRELVADYAIVKYLNALKQWDYSTSDYSKLSSEQQLVVLVDQAILIDRMYFCLHALKQVLMHANNLLDEFEFLDWRVYYVVGFLNFKIHEYDKARKCFEKVCRNIKINAAQLNNSEDSKKIFHARLLIAYCYEYSGKFQEAIEAMGIDPKEINTIVKKYSIEDVEKCHDAILEEIINKSKEGSLFKDNLNSYSSFKSDAKQERLKRLNTETIDKNLDLDKKFEILHAFGHCLNEYAIKTKTVLKEKGKKGQSSETLYTGGLLCLARTTMHVLAEYRIEYSSCYGEMFGEYRDYTKALEILEEYEGRIKASDNKSETLLAEISFYKFYFNLLCNRIDDTDKDIFENYYTKYDDDDAECYLKIFEFRLHLKKYAYEVLNTFNEALTDYDGNNELDTNASSEQLKTEYDILAGLSPTLYLNVNVRAEHRSVRRAYICIEKMRQYVDKQNDKSFYELINACARFSSVRRDNYQSNLVNPGNSSENSETIIPHHKDTAEWKDAIKDVYTSLFRNDSIFILAPISGVIVFQYQTGSISELFNEDTLILTKGTSRNIKEDQFEDTINEIINERRNYLPRRVVNVNWDRIKNFCEKIYYWESDLPDQLLISSSDGKNYMRRISDAEGFEKHMNGLHKKYLDSRGPCVNELGEHYDNKTYRVCDFQDLSWAEIINEKRDKKVRCCIYWKHSGSLRESDGNPEYNGEYKCLIVPYNNGNRCVLHNEIFYIAAKPVKDEKDLEKNQEKQLKHLKQYEENQLKTDISTLKSMSCNKLEYYNGTDIADLEEDNYNIISNLENVLEILNEAENELIKESFEEAKTKYKCAHDLYSTIFENIPEW